MTALGCKSSEKTAKDQEVYIPTVDFAGQIDEESLSFIKDNYAWAEGSILVINYRQPRKSCHFDNHLLDKEAKRWWEDFYVKVNAENYTNIFVYSEGERVIKHLDFKVYFHDQEDFLLTNFFGRKKSCFGVLVLDEAGNYYQYNGHYSERQVAKFIDALQKPAGLQAQFRFRT